MKRWDRVCKTSRAVLKEAAGKGIISGKRLEGKIKFDLRVKKPERKVEVEALASENEVFAKKLMIVRASETLRLEIPGENLSKAEECCHLKFEVEGEQT